MNKVLTIFVFSLVAHSTFASQIPPELSNLIPTGSNSINMEGRTEKDNKTCKSEFRISNDVMNVYVSVYKTNGEMDVLRFGKFQLGFGYELQKLSSSNTSVHAVTFHDEEMQFMSDIRTSLMVSKQNGKISSVRVKVEESGILPFIFSTKTDETCLIQ